MEDGEWRMENGFELGITCHSESLALQGDLLGGGTSSLHQMSNAQYTNDAAFGSLPEAL